MNLLVVTPKEGTSQNGDRILRAAVEHYAHCRSYRDRGVLTASTLGTPGRRSLSVSRFDTAFLRHVGFRFRFYNESGQLQAALWRRGDKTQLWHLGNTREPASFGDALIQLRGVSGLSSEIVGSLAYGIAIFTPERSPFHGPPAIAGIAPIHCGKCWLVSVGTDPKQSQAVFTIDENARALRRFQSVTNVPKDPQDGSAAFTSDLLIAYEPEFDLADEAALARELETQPW